MPAWIIALFSSFGSYVLKVMIDSFFNTATSFVTEKRVRKYMVYGARKVATAYPKSEWINKIAQDMEKDWEDEWKEDI